VPQSAAATISKCFYLDDNCMDDKSDWAKKCFMLETAGTMGMGSTIGDQPFPTGKTGRGLFNLNLILCRRASRIYALS